jgi:hypothetical protein
MKKLLSLVLFASLCTPAFAQKMGGTNRNAPTIKQSITVAGATISLDYTSITWASGETMKTIMDKANGGGAREMVNNNAMKTPLGTFTSTIAVSCGDLNLAAGEYKVYFTIDDNCDWSVNFQGKDKTDTMKLPLMDSPEESKRLLLCLYAGEKEGAGTYVSFGNKMCMLEFKPAAEKKQG